MSKLTPDLTFWAKQTVLVTGGAGFLGSHVVALLEKSRCRNISVPRSQTADLRIASVINDLLRKTRPTMIIHLAAVCGGIGANQAEPGRFFYDNAIMGIQLMEYARQCGVQKFVQVGTVCAYPKFTPVPFKETNLWNGFPEETNAPYGLAKKMLLVQAQAYREQYGFNAIYLLPANLYGPRDNFDLQTSHVIPALIRKVLEAKERGSDHIDVWGTGTPTREFLYVADAADGIVSAAERYNDAEPVNMGTGRAVSIRALVKLICKIAGYQGRIRWQAHKPDGQPSRRLDVSRAQKAFGFRAHTKLEEGLRLTLDWYQNRRAIREKAIA